MLRELDTNNVSAKSVTPIRDNLIITPLTPQNTSTTPQQPGLRKEGSGGKTIRGQRQRKRYERPDGVRPRVPRKVLQAGNQFDIDMGRQGYYKCPHLGIYCSCGSARDIESCRGHEYCLLREDNTMVDRLWKSHRENEKTMLPLLAN